MPVKFGPDGHGIRISSQCNSGFTGKKGKTDCLLGIFSGENIQ